MKSVMANIICLECGVKCDNEARLHRHIKAHKLSQAEYYFKHFPRYDKFDGRPIIFKNKESYFETSFNSVNNLKDWLMRANPEEAKRYIKTTLLARKRLKNLIYTPSQIELRSLSIPGMVYLNNLFGDYYNEMATLGFKNKFNKSKFNGIWQPFHVEHKVLVDSREQLPLVFDNIKTIHTGLEFGDYKLNDDNFSHNCCIERKSLADLCSTLKGGIERFRRELLRAQNAGYYMVVLVEEPFISLLQLSKKDKVGQHLEYVLHNMRLLCQEFTNMQFLFVENRDEASEVILKLFSSDGQFKDIDLQYAYDKGVLI